MEIPSRDKFKHRVIETLFTCPKIFFGAFLWEGFSLGCQCSDYALSFYWMAGIGCAIGTHVGHVGISFLAQRFNTHGDFNAFKEMSKGFLYAICVLLGPGTAWQSIVNDTDRWGFTFTQAFFFMWLCSMLLFFVSITVFRYVVLYVADKMKWTGFEHFKATLYSDFMLSLSVGCGDAFFMGTSAPENFSDNWLAPGFGVWPGTPTGTAMFSAGASTLIGFFGMQMVQNVLMKYTWTDPTENEEEKTLLQKSLETGGLWEDGGDKQKSIELPEP